MKCRTIDLGFNLFVYALSGGSKTATQDCPITICHAALVRVCVKESWVVMRVHKYVCVWVSVYVCGGVPVDYKEIFLESRTALL